MNRRERRLQQFRPAYYADMLRRATGSALGATTAISVPVNYKDIGNERRKKGTNRTMVMIQPTEQEK